MNAVVPRAPGERIRPYIRLLKICAGVIGLLPCEVNESHRAHYQSDQSDDDAQLFCERPAFGLEHRPDLVDAAVKCDAFAVQFGAVELPVVFDISRPRDGHLLSAEHHFARDGARAWGAASG